MILLVNPPGQGTPSTPSLFSLRRIVLIGAAFGSLIILADVYDEKVAFIIGISLFGVMLFTTDMGFYISDALKDMVKKARL